MSSCSRNDRRLSGRPTLPPIRDLLQGLRDPHDSSSLTLARLRVSDDSDVLDSYPPRTFDDQTLGTPSEHLWEPPSPEHNYQYHDHRNAYITNSHQSNPDGRWSSASLPGHALLPSEGPDGNEPSHNSPIDVSQRWSHQTSLRRDTFDPSGYPYEHRPFQHRDDNSRSYLQFDVSYQGHNHMGTHSSRPGEISTAVASGHSSDDERTPVACYRSAGPSNLQPITQKASEDKPSGSTISKYECSYCGKGFTRPSSLKIHLNSHTGEKPFVCPVKGCGRSFSVLSNMRRHARVHPHILEKQPEHSSDDDSEKSATSDDLSRLSATGSALDHSRSTDVSPHRWHQRRDSGTSTSSSTSTRRSHSYSSHEQPDTSPRPEKRLRGRPE